MSELVGVPRFELGLNPPHGLVLPLHYSPYSSKFTQKTPHGNKRDAFYYSLQTTYLQVFIPFEASCANFYAFSGLPAFLVGRQRSPLQIGIMPFPLDRVIVRA